MEIILLEQVENLGNVGDVVNVKNGFARNLLLPTKKALLATPENKAYYEAEKASIVEKNDKIKKTAEKFFNAINGKDVYILRQSSEEGKLYGSVMPRDIAERLSEYFKSNVQKKQIVQERPIRELGLYTIKVRIHAEYIASVTINVARTVDEAKANIANAKAEKKAKAEAQAKPAAKASEEASKDESKEEVANSADNAEDNAAS